MKQNEKDVDTVNEQFKSEWQRRTTYGKIWFPLWASINLLELALVTVVFCIVFPGAVLKPLSEKVVPPINRAVERLIASARGPFPEVYQDE